jgi:hypothetical protein
MLINLRPFITEVGNLVEFMIAGIREGVLIFLFCKPTKKINL